MFALIIWWLQDRRTQLRRLMVDPRIDLRDAVHGARARLRPGEPARSLRCRATHCICVVELAGIVVSAVGAVLAVWCVITFALIGKERRLCSTRRAIW